VKKDTTVRRSRIQLHVSPPNVPERLKKEKKERKGKKEKIYRQNLWITDYKLPEELVSNAVKWFLKDSDFASIVSKLVDLRHRQYTGRFLSARLLPGTFFNITDICTITIISSLASHTIQLHD
jgi:hypothetical protein